MKCESLLLLVLSAVGLCTNRSDDPTLVTLPEGKIRGHALRSPKNNVYYAFQEIPYASPPVGQLRFQPPVAPKKWDGILDATNNTKKCYQRTDYPIPGIVQSEDCLYINVFTPVKPRNCGASLPVLIWIHGGSDDGAGVPQVFKPQLFMDYNIIVVMMNFRLGALAYATTADGVIPANIGLRDQHFAIQWVNRNIHLFGGDPQKVTICGESSGAAAAGLQLISKQNRGLFRAVILQSGSPIAQWTRQDYPRFYAFELGRNVDPNFTSYDSNELLRLLQNAPVSSIVNNTVPVSRGKETLLVQGTGDIWLPVVEEGITDAFITGVFYQEIKKGNINRVPTLIGFNSEEGLLYMASDPSVPTTNAKYFDTDPANLIGNKYNMSKEDKAIAGRKIKEIYTNGTFQNDLAAIVKFFTDEIFITPVSRHAEMQSSYTDIFLYEFSHMGKMGGLPNVEVAGVRGVGHAEELGYLWDAPIGSDDTPDWPQDLVMRERLLLLWTNFVKYLHPTPKRDSTLQNITWEKLTPHNLVYLNINDTMKMEKNPRNFLQRERIIDRYAIPPLRNY